MMNEDTSFLYVEDDPLSREVIRIALEKVMGFKKVWIFEDTTDFMERVEALEGVPDVILLDIHIQPVSGLEALGLLRRNGRFEKARIIAITASVMNEEVELLKASGFDGGIGKPIDPDLFPELVQRIINGETVWHVS